MGRSRASRSADGRWLATGSLDKSVRLWDLPAGTSRRIGTQEDAVISVAITPDGRRVASGGFAGGCRIWDVGTGATRACAGDAGAVYALSFTTDGGRLIAGTEHGGIRVLSLDTGREERIPTESSIRAIAASGDGAVVAVGGDDRVVRIWDLRAHTSRTLHAFTTPISALDLSRDGRRVAAASRSDVLVGDLDMGWTRTLPVDNASAVALSPDGRSVAVGSKSGAVQVFPLDAGEIDLHVDLGVRCVAASPTGSRVAVGTGRGLETFDLAGGAHARISLPGPVAGAAFTPDGQQLLIGERSGAVSLVPFAGGAPRLLSPGRGETVAGVACSHQGRKVAWAGEDGRAFVLDVSTGATTRLTEGNPPFYELAFSPDDAHLYGASWDKTIFVWTLATGETTTLSGHRNWVVTLDVSGDGRTLASGGTDGEVRLWDLVGAGAGGSRVLRGHGGALSAVRFSPDHTRLVSSDAQGAVRLWDAEAGALLLERQREATDSQVAFLSDGRVVDAFPDGTVRVWSDDLPHTPEALRAWIARATQPLE